MQVTFDSAAAPSQVVTDRYGGMIAKYYKVDAALVDMSMRGEGRWYGRGTGVQKHLLYLLRSTASALVAAAWQAAP